MTAMARTSSFKLHDETNRKEADLNTEVVLTFRNFVIGLWFIQSNIIPKLLLNGRTKRGILLLSYVSELSKYNQVL